VTSQPHNPIPPPPPHPRAPLALELGRHLGRLVGPHESRIVDLDPLEAAPLEHGREARPCSRGAASSGSRSTIRDSCVPTSLPRWRPSSRASGARGWGGGGGIGLCGWEVT